MVFLAACLFFLSGAAALAYEVVWVKLLTLQFGSAAWSISTVVASFMAGLGAGGAWAGRRADRIRRPLRAYALLELGIALYGVVSVPLMRNMAGILDPLYGLTDGYFAPLPAAAVPPLLRHDGGADLPHGRLPAPAHRGGHGGGGLPPQRGPALRDQHPRCGGRHPRGGDDPDAHPRDLRHGVGRRRRGCRGGGRGLPPRSAHGPPGCRRGGPRAGRRGGRDPPPAAGGGGHGRMPGPVLPDRLDAPAHPGGGLLGLRLHHHPHDGPPRHRRRFPAGRRPLLPGVLLLAGRWPSPWGWARARPWRASSP